MIPYKVKVEKTELLVRTELKSRYGLGYALTLQAIYYSSTNPTRFIHILDADGDGFLFPMPGQHSPQTTTPEIPITVKLPLYYFDEAGDCELILWGEVEKIQTILETNL